MERSGEGFEERLAPHVRSIDAEGRERFVAEPPLCCDTASRDGREGHVKPEIYI